jgi:hypothetical protein
MRSRVLAIALILMLQACGGKHEAVVPSPSKVLLTAPAQNAVCVTGTSVSNGQSSVSFTWGASANTDSYTVVLKNLLTSASTTQNTTSTQLTITLDQNTPYSWYVVSKSSQTSATAQSDTWKFYNSGPGIVTYPPYPAEITSPTFGQLVTAASGTISLTWTGSSVTAGTILNYDVYFGTTSTPAIFKGAITDSFVNSMSVVSGTTYYWKVITRDKAGNTSDSGLYQFIVN